MRRRGLGKGLGTGYKNLAPMDSHIHSLSAKGVSQKKIIGISNNIARELNMRKIMTEKINGGIFDTYEDYDEELRMDVDVKKKRILITENEDMSGSLLNLNAKGDWDKIKGGTSPDMWGNKKKGGFIFVSKLQYPEGENKWRFGGVNGRGYFKETHTKTKEEAQKLAEKYMEVK